MTPDEQPFLVLVKGVFQAKEVRERSKPKPRPRPARKAEPTPAPAAKPLAPTPDDGLLDRRGAPPDLPHMHAKGEDPMTTPICLQEALATLLGVAPEEIPATPRLTTVNQDLAVLNWWLDGRRPAWRILPQAVAAASGEAPGAALARTPGVDLEHAVILCGRSPEGSHAEVWRRVAGFAEAAVRRAG